MQQPSEPVNIVAEPASSPDHGLTLLKTDKPTFRWYHKTAAVMTAVFCFELGAFLLIYPWVDDWDTNLRLVPMWARALWLDYWFRGAISGLGMVNIYISFLEVFRFKRFSA